MHFLSHNRAEKLIELRYVLGFLQVGGHWLDPEAMVITTSGETSYADILKIMKSNPQLTEITDSHQKSKNS